MDPPRVAPCQLHVVPHVLVHVELDPYGASLRIPQEEGLGIVPDSQNVAVQGVPAGHVGRLQTIRLRSDASRRTIVSRQGSESTGCDLRYRNDMPSLLVHPGVA